MNYPPLSSRSGIRFRQSLAFKLLLSVTLIIFALTITLTATDVLDVQRRAEDNEAQRLTGLYTGYNADIQELKNEASALAISMADRQDIKEMLIKRNRDGMIGLLTPVFNQLKEKYRIVDLYIENPDGTVFVRIHDPSQYGDSVMYRQTVATTRSSRNTTAGVEVSPNGLSIRGVTAVFNGNEFLGMIEVGLDFDKPFLENLKNRNDADYNVWITNSGAAPAGLKPQENALPSPSSKFFFYAGTLSDSTQIPEEVYLRVLRTATPEVQYTTINGQEHAVLVAPLLAYGRQVIGIFEIVRSREQTLAEIRSDTINGIVVALLVGIVSLAGMWWAAQRQVLRPIAELSATALKQSRGDLKARAQLDQQDEFGQLGHVLNNLAEQLSDTIQNLENSVEERTKALSDANEANSHRARQFEAISQVAGSIASIRSLEELLPRVTQLISTEFGFYHVGIFLIDDSNEYAVLSAANSVGGQRMLARGHRLQVGAQGIVGYVTGTGNPRVALNTGADAVYFNNPDLPDTRSEMALPLTIAGKVIGALDVQSLKPNAFEQQDIEVLSTLANQVSLAIQNARSFLETRRLLAESQSMMTGYVTDSWKVLRPTSLSNGYEKTGSEIRPLEQKLEGEHINQALEQGKTTTEMTKLAVPIRLRGQVIGIMNLQIPEGHRWTANEVSIAEAVAERLSLAIETATLIKATQRRAEIERITAEITGRISTSSQLETILQTAAQELNRALGGSDVLVQIEPVSMKLSLSG